MERNNFYSVFLMENPRIKQITYFSKHQVPY